MKRDISRREFLKHGAYLGLLLSAGSSGCLLKESAKVPTETLKEGVAPINVAKNAAETFFSQVKFRIYDLTGTTAKIEASAPEVMVCPFVFGKDESYGRMQFMVMTGPAKNHQLQLVNLEADTTYKWVDYTINPNLEVYRSKVITFKTAPNPIGSNSIMEGEGEPHVIKDFEPASKIMASKPEVATLRSNFALIKFSTFKEVFAAVVFGTSNSYGRLRRMPVNSPVNDHQVQLVGLKPKTTYHYNVVMVDKRGDVYVGNDLTFTTPEATGFVPSGENVALSSLGAKVTGASSDWGPSFAPVFAIDGDPGTEWASDGDGNNAWIEISLDKEYDVDAIGFWTRTMGDSAQIFKFKVLIDGEELGLFEVPDAAQPYYYTIPEINAKKLKFEVVESNGGNTGTLSIEVFKKGSM